MAAGKISPRQKMIGMMYLVLTALLALNVSKDILRSFVVVNNGLENTEKTFSKDVTNLYAKFDEKKTIDPQRVMDSWKKAQLARKMSQELGVYIDGLKKTLIRETEGFTNKEEDTIRLSYVESKDNFDTPTFILIGDSEDGSAGEAIKLKQRLINYKKEMLALLPEADRKQINLTIDTDDPKNPEEDERTWEMFNFYHTPLAASVTLLSKIQTDVKSAEVDIVDALLKSADADVIPFDTVAARIVAQSNYVLLGEDYQADIFLAAFNKTLKPQVYVGDYNTQTSKFNGAFDSVNVERGIGKYSVPASSEGIKKYSGVISMKTPKGKMMQFPFESEYIVARPALTVAADKMSVMYAGLPNPISVSVPGIPNEKIKVSINNGNIRMTSSGKYEVTNPKIGVADVSVTATMDDGTTRNMGVMKFKVKPLPMPVASFAGVSGVGKKKASELSSALGLILTYPPDFDFQAKPTLTSFELTTITNGISSSKTYYAPSIDQAVRSQLGAMRKGSVLLIENIKASGADLRQVNPQGVTIYIK